MGCLPPGCGGYPRDGHGLYPPSTLKRARKETSDIFLYICIRAARPGRKEGRERRQGEKRMGRQGHLRALRAAVTIHWLATSLALCLSPPASSFLVPSLTAPSEQTSMRRGNPRTCLGQAAPKTGGGRKGLPSFSFLAPGRWTVALPAFQTGLTLPGLAKPPHIYLETPRAESHYVNAHSTGGQETLISALGALPNRTPRRQGLLPCPPHIFPSLF